MSVLLKGGFVVNSDRKFRGDILIENGEVKQIGLNLSPTNPDIRIIDVNNKLVIPGPIDGLTNFKFQNGSEQTLLNETGAAITGGNTTIINVIEKDEIENVFNKNIKSMCNYGFVVNIKSDDASAPDFMDVCARNYGINCFQVTIKEPISKSLIDIAMKASNLGCSLRIKYGGDSVSDLITQSLISNDTIGPEAIPQCHGTELETSFLLRYLALIKVWPHVAICPNVASELASELISQYKCLGYPIFGEVATPHLGLDGSKYNSESWDEAASFVTEPPIQINQADKIIKQLANSNNGIDFISSHHTTVTTSQRLIGQSDFRNITKGCIGTEERLSVLWHKAVATGLISECDFVKLISTNVAQLYNLYPTRGRIAIGSIGDIIIWDPRGVNSRIGHVSMLNNVDDAKLYNGLKNVYGRVDAVIINGQVKYENQNCIGQPDGIKITMKPSSPFVMEKIKRWKLQLEMENMNIIRDRTSIEASKIDTIQPKVPQQQQQQTQSNLDNRPIGSSNPSDIGYKRPPTSGGTRNMQDSSFSLSGAQIDDNRPGKSTIRTNQPPGGKSSITF